MAAELIGRTACPECGFAAAHVKRTIGKAGARAYRYCPSAGADDEPGCGAQYFPRNARQERDLMAKTRPEGGQATDQAEAKPATPAPASGPADPLTVDPPTAPAPAPAKPAPARPAGLFGGGGLFGGRP